MLERPWSRLSHWWFVPTQWSSCIPANLCPGESGRAVSFHLSADDEFNLKQKSNGGFKLATSPLDTCFADLGIDYLCHPDNALNCVPTAHGRPPSEWFFCFCRECRAEWTGGDADSSEKHKGLCRSVLTFFTFFISLLGSSSFGKVIYLQCTSRSQDSSASSTFVGVSNE